jgi:hypothetical protein
LRRVFEGEICGVGTATGYRIVIGRWTSSPFGPFADVMVESDDGVRILLAPSDEIATYVSSTYEFDDVRIVEVQAQRAEGGLTCRAGPLDLSAVIGPRTGLGRLLRLVPARVASSPAWCSAIDPIARVVLDGVRTRGSAGNDRREFYGATDQRAITGVRAAWAGSDLGDLTDVWPPVRFGFSSTPRRPCAVAVTTVILSDPS